MQVAIFLSISLLFPCITAAQDFGCEPGTLRYQVSLRDRAAHIAHVQLAYEGGGEQDFQLPAWNALYQVRDFAQYVTRVEARDGAGRLLSHRKLDKSTWRIDADAKHGCSILSYDVVADTPGSFGAQINADHAFLNWAMVLMYPVDGRAAPIRIRITDLPTEWRVADGEVFPRTSDRGAVSVEGAAEKYDALVDSPVEIGKFTESSFEEGGATYRVIVHGEPSDFDMAAIKTMLRKVVAAAVDWMQDRPYKQYTFIYHLPRGPASGGMEHAYSTAIDVDAQRVADHPLSLSGVSAHEFFHLWNVKRIRPRTLEPVDYTRENYTRALWFSEGVTSTVQEHMLYRAGLIDEQQFLDRLAFQISSLESRAAHSTQSAEESSLDAWLEKYPYYHQPERSVSYYTNGQILGVLLDLRMREVTRGIRSLRDLFQWMNANYAKRGIFFDDSVGVQKAAESVTGASFQGFFSHYVAGTQELPYDELFRSVGLKLARRTTQVASAGFTTSRRFDQPAIVTGVEEGSDAQAQGIATGDAILEMNGKPVSGNFAATIAAAKANDTVRLKVRSRRGEREVNIRISTRMGDDYVLNEAQGVTNAQRARRLAWMRGDSETGTKATPIAGAATGGPQQ
ncbi:MAG TPA: PDZ domain-containing protein [Clostridia bacterium]|nr:PDZ domain-containing protein [Clostridia bacterium]